MGSGKKNIGILFSSSRKMGVFQYGLSIVEALINYCPHYNYTILYFENENPKYFLKIKNLENVKFISLDASPNNFFGKLKFIFNIILGNPIFVTNKKNKEIMKDVKIDLLIIPFQLMFGFEHRIPYIVSIPDVMYKHYSNLPEYSFKNRLINNFIFKSSTKYSVLTIADSSFGKNDIHTFLNVPKEKIEAIPYLPAGYVFGFKGMTKEQADKILGKYDLPENFIFYPAQFWVHKNHVNLIKSIKIAEEKFGENISLVLVGNEKANSENYYKIMGLAGELNIKNRIMHLGYVTDEEIVALYKKSLALIFCSVGGPTNIPLVEAMFLGTPVVCPNLFAMPEQVGDAGVLFNPFNPNDMAEKIVKVWKDENLRSQMIEKGYKKVESFTFESYAKIWISAVEKALNNIEKGK
ncbi:MAG: glycosyltransferase family 4 protein [Candidatus Staskawiczbacteria bacterium]|nr:glycosyltransferase family 4 protein [Candidatus Staskawiczbacteria bacterium]